MDERNNKLQTAVNTARFTRAARRIRNAAAAAGLKGAALAAVEEAAPMIVRFAIGFLIAVFLIPMLVFTAMPNMFFGFGSSETEDVMDMTEQALTIGGAYMSLEDFENTQMDSVVTSIVNQYENEGTKIDKIVVHSSFNEDDLLWMIAINSVAYRQDLNAMTAQDIRNLSRSQLTSRSSFSLFGGGDVETTLEIGFDALDPVATMESHGFDEEDVTWATALHDILEKSDVLSQYADYFEAYKTDYSGDSSYQGDYEHSEGTTSNDIDNSRFSSPYTKNNHDLVVFAKQAWENNWGYVWGSALCSLTICVEMRNKTSNVIKISERRKMPHAEKGRGIIYWEKA